MLFTVHFAVWINATKLEDKSFKRCHKIKPGAFTFKYFGYVFAKWYGQRYGGQVHKNNTY